MKCFYHNDADGFMSALCVAVHGGECGERGDFRAIDYQDPFPLNEIKPDELVYIVDFSIPPEVMAQLLDITPNVVWIDHHKTAIEKYFGFSHTIEGVRDTNHSGCHLTWYYLTANPNFPEAIQLVEDRDMWWWKFGDKTRFFHSGLLSRDWYPTNDMLQSMLLPRSAMTDILIEAGKAIEQYREKWARRYCDAFAYEAEFEGHRCIALNNAHWGSEIFCGRDADYQVAILYNHLGDQWRVSLYSKGVDVSALAKKYGGGGHPGAAGFVCTELPWSKK